MQEVLSSFHCTCFRGIIWHRSPNHSLPLLCGRYSGLAPATFIPLPSSHPFLAEGRKLKTTFSIFPCHHCLQMGFRCHQSDVLSENCHLKLRQMVDRQAWCFCAGVLCGVGRRVLRPAAGCGFPSAGPSQCGQLLLWGTNSATWLWELLLEVQLRVCFLAFPKNSMSCLWLSVNLFYLYHLAWILLSETKNIAKTALYFFFNWWIIYLDKMKTSPHFIFIQKVEHFKCISFFSLFNTIHFHLVPATVSHFRIHV